MKLTPLLISIVLMGGVMLGMANFYGDIQNTYNPDNSTSTEDFKAFNESFTTMNELMNRTSQHTVGAATKSLTDPSKYTDALMAFIDVGGVILEMPNTLMTGYVNNMTKYIPDIPTWFITVILTIIAIIFVMRVAALFTKTDEI